MTYDQYTELTDKDLAINFKSWDTSIQDSLIIVLISILRAFGVKSADKQNIRINFEKVIKNNVYSLTPSQINKLRELGQFDMDKLLHPRDPKSKYTTMNRADRKLYSKENTGLYTSIKDLRQHCKLKTPKQESGFCKIEKGIGIYDYYYQSLTPIGKQLVFGDKPIKEVLKTIGF